MQSDQENFLSRWSRRKQQATQEPDIPQTLEEEISAAQKSGLTPEQLLEQETALTEETEAPVLTDADMPPIESLTEDSDYSGFMSKGVSDELRNLALRKLFNASIFNVRDGLDEYDEDFTTFEKLGDIITCDMKHAMEIEAKKKLEQEQEAAAMLEEDEMEDIEDDIEDIADEDVAEEEMDDNDSNEKGAERLAASDDMSSIQPGNSKDEIQLTEPDIEQKTI